MKAAQVISDKTEVLAHLARVCHAHAQGSLLEHIPISDRFNSGDRQIILELYGQKIISLAKERILRFRESPEGVDPQTALYFSQKLAKALNGVIDQERISYIPRLVVTLVMSEFEAIPRYKNYSLVLS